MKMLMALCVGLLFGFGLSLGGMTQPAVVLGFLDIFGHWNPQLAFVMGGAVLTTMIGFRLVWKRSRPLFDEKFQLPTAKDLDFRLVAGSATFGIGWGLGGYCPGPALASLSSGVLPGFLPVFVLVGTMIVGWWLAARLPAAKA